MSSPVTLVTGTSKGIGRGLAEHYLAKGHTVIGCSRSRPEWSADGYRHFELDVADERAVQAMLSTLNREVGRLDNLVNNAGIAAMNHVLLTPLKTLERIVDTNLLGTFLFSREAARLMQRAKSGRIVNLTSVAVPLNLEGEAAYAASKAGVESLTRIMARELSPYGITVNAVGPTPIETDLIRGVPKAKMDALLARQALGRFGELKDVVNAVDFFLRPESDFVTGQVLYLGGV